jgi:cytidine deaminase
LAGSDRGGAPRWPQDERRGAGTNPRKAERRAPAASTGPALPADGPDRRGSQRRVRDRRDEAAWQGVSLDTPLDTALTTDAALLAAAVGAREHAQARYSGFKVGAALETLDGAVVTGCNIENASYGLTLCAERVALVKALSEGHRAFTRIAVAADTESPTPPCGACRQLLWEYCGDIDVILGNLEAVAGQHRLASLLPLPFDSRLLE